MVTAPQRDPAELPPYDPAKHRYTVKGEKGDSLSSRVDE